MAVVCGLAAALLALAILWSRWRLLPKPPADRSYDLAMHANRAVAVLHALIMALVFAEAEIDYTRARESVWREADLLHDVFRGLSLYGSDKAEEISVQVADYTRSLAETEWGLLSENQLSDQASQQFQAAYTAVLHLATSDAAQTWLRDQILASMTQLSGLRHERFFEAHDRLPVIFWLIIVLGYLLLCGLFSIYAKTRLNMAILATFGFFFGLVSYLIFAFEDPFDGHLGVTAKPLVLLYDEVMAPTIAARGDG